jgi:hypothetical protein
VVALVIPSSPIEVVLIDGKAVLGEEVRHGHAEGLFERELA